MKVQNSNINFKAGLTSGMKQQIASCDVKKVSGYFAKNGIPTDFKGNKIVAWCSLKSLKIIKTLNEKYHLKWGLPKGLFVEDFDVLNIPEKQAPGFVNLTPTLLYKNKNISIPEKTIFFNEFKYFNYEGGNECWDKIDEIADCDFKSKYAPTDFFLDPFLHEFMHVVHESNMFNILGKKKTYNTIEKALLPENISKFQKKYGKFLESICEYACVAPFEAISCDLTKRIIKNLDKNKLIPIDDFIKNSPYEKLSFLKKYAIYHPAKKKDDILRKIWNGKIDLD